MFEHLAVNPEHSKGRLYDEFNDDKFRTPFERDRGRVIHSSSFRKLKHKTQVFIESESDYYRTRLTHSLEVAQISRSLCRLLGINEDLGETVALAHDLGHPPFGHSGEKALNTSMNKHGGFNHNDQTIRVLTFIEKRHPNFNGLNLTWESLEGIVKHNGIILKNTPFHINQYNSIHDVIETTDVLYMTRIQKERLTDENLDANLEFIENNLHLTQEIMTNAKQNMVIMHPLPRNDELNPTLDNDPRAAYFRQMENGLYVRMALIQLLL